jgi:outer membrane protein insertion porin family
MSPALRIGLLALVASAALTACAAPPEASAPPAQEQLEVRLSGELGLPERDLRRAAAADLEDLASSLVEEGLLDEAHADDAAFAVAATLRAAGYPDAACSFELAEDAVVLRVRCGPRCILTGVEVEGELRVLERDQVALPFEGPRQGLLGRGDPVFVEARVRSAPGTLLREYRARGHLDARIGEPEITLSADRTTARVRVAIEEGPQRTLGRITPADALTESLVPGFSSLGRAEAEEGAPLPFTPRVPLALRGEVLERLAGVGYPDAEVEVTAAEPDASGRVDLVVAARPGPRVTLTGVRFEGDPRTDPEFLASRATLQPGDLWDVRAERRSTARLYETGFYTRIDSRLEGDGADRELVFLLEPRSTKEVWVEPGYGSYERLRLRFGARDRNVLGSGQTLKFEAAAAQRALRSTLALVNPWFLQEELISDLSVEFSRRELPSFTNERVGTGAFVTREWEPGGRTATSFGYQLRATRALDVEVGAGAPDSLSDDRAANIASLKLAHTAERRDSPLLPRAGWFAQASAEVADTALGSELAFTRFVLSASRLVTVREGLTLAGALRGGVALPRGDEELPLQERFFNGGENAVRCFRETELGPTDAAGNPVGGEATLTANLELRQDLWSPGIHAAAFLDAGAVSLDALDWLDPEDPRWGWGVGLRYLLPVGPLRLDLGINPEPRPGEDDWVLHLSVGMPF